MYLDKVYAIREFSLNMPLMLQKNSNWDYYVDVFPRYDVVKDDFPIFSLSFTDFPVNTPGDFGCLVPSFATNDLAIYLTN